MEVEHQPAPPYTLPCTHCEETASARTCILHNHGIIHRQALYVVYKKTYVNLVEFHQHSTLPPDQSLGSSGSKSSVALREVAAWIKWILWEKMIVSA